MLTDCEPWEHQPPALLLVSTGVVPRVGESVWIARSVLRGRARTWDELNAPTIEFEVIEVRYEMTGSGLGARVDPIVVLQWKGPHG